MLQRIIDTLLSVPPVLALLIIGVLVFGEAALFFGFVLPGETAVVYGGVLAEAGKVSVVLVLLVVVAAAIVGDSVGFEVGRRLGPRLTESALLERHRDRIHGAQEFLRLRGGRAVVLGRFTAFLRAVMPALAGVSRMPYPRFLAFNALGGVLWGSACVLLGFFAAHSLSAVSRTLGWTSAACVAIIALGLVFAWHRRGSAHRG